MARQQQGIHVGTSGWTYDDWTGRFYPEEVKGAERLPYYATRFDTVEVNATFYRLPGRNMITGWNRRLAADFHMVAKGSRQVTHIKRLGDVGEQVGRFWERVAPLETLRVVLWQLPPSFRRDGETLARLEGFLGQLPGAVRHAVEFRHESWWDEAVYDLLGRHGVAFVAVSHPGLPGTVVPTTDLLYVRFHGLGKELYRYDSGKDELRDWAGRVRPHLRGRTLYAFFNNDYEAHAPANAETFRGLLRGD